MDIDIRECELGGYLARVPEFGERLLCAWGRTKEEAYDNLDRFGRRPFLAADTAEKMEILKELGSHRAVSAVEEDVFVDALIGLFSEEEPGSDRSFSMGRLAMAYELVAAEGLGAVVGGTADVRDELSVRVGAMWAYLLRSRIPLVDVPRETQILYMLETASKAVCGGCDDILGDLAPRYEVPAAEENRFCQILGEIAISWIAVFSDQDPTSLDRVRHRVSELLDARTYSSDGNDRAWFDTLRYEALYCLAECCRSVVDILIQPSKCRGEDVYYKLSSACRLFERAGEIVPAIVVRWLHVAVRSLLEQNLAAVS